MSSLLEARYRRALRLLPAPYRRAWEDDMVATFLEGAHAADPDDPEGVELGGPGRAELASIVGLALRLRLGGVESAPRYLAWGEAVRRVALVGLLVHAVNGLVGAAVGVWLVQRLPGLTVPADAPGTPGWPEALWGLAGLLWLPAYLSVVYGHRRAAAALAVVAITPVAAFTVLELVAFGGAFALSHSYWLLFDAVPVLALAAFHHAAPPVAPRPWLVAVPVGAVLSFGVVLLTQPLAGHEVLVDIPGLYCAGLVVAALAVGACRRRGLGLAPWALALALLALGVFGLRVVTLLDHVGLAAPAPDQSTFVTLAVAESAAVLAVGLVLAAVAGRTLRRLPAESIPWAPDGR